MNTCRRCGKEIGKGAALCGMCSPMKRRAGGIYRYTRTHIHEWADGRLTVEDGVKCECCTCHPGSAENGWHEQRCEVCIAAEMKEWGHVIAWHRNGDIVKRIRERAALEGLA